MHKIPKLRQHNEWFQPVVKKTCECGKKKVQVVAWGEYHRARWRRIIFCCEGCFSERVVQKLTIHSNNCKCSFNLVPRSGYSLPSWIKMPEVCKVI